MKYLNLTVTGLNYVLTGSSGRVCRRPASCSGSNRVVMMITVIINQITGKY